MHGAFVIAVGQLRFDRFRVVAGLVAAYVEECIEFWIDCINPRK